MGSGPFILKNGEMTDESIWEEELPSGSEAEAEYNNYCMLSAIHYYASKRLAELEDMEKEANEIKALTDLAK